MNKTIRLFTTAAPVLLLMGSSGCTWGLGGGGSETTEMHRHFSRIGDIQTGVVVGDMDRVKAAGEWLASYEGLVDTNPQAKTSLEKMRAEASRISKASDLQSVAEATGRLAASCGSCHQATGGGPNFVVGSSPPMGDSEGAVMIRHLWAADRMWEGLVGPSTETWLAGTEALQQGWDRYRGAIEASHSPTAARKFVDEVQEIAVTASAATTQEARAISYGDLLATCNRCHSGLGAVTER
jgi:cytochrome c556